MSSVGVAGVFVGGTSSRMGGRPKGMLATREGVTIVARTIALTRAVASEVVLVGRADAYGELGVASIADDGTGPLAGLAALLEHAGAGAVLALACDMPYVTASMVNRLATHAPDASAVAPRDGRAWSPFFARYPTTLRSLVRAKLAEGAGPSAVLDAAGAVELPLTEDERRALRDWDRPEDVDV